MTNAQSKLVPKTEYTPLGKTLQRCAGVGFISKGTTKCYTDADVTNFDALFHAPTDRQREEMNRIGWQTNDANGMYFNTETKSLTKTRTAQIGWARE